jgi:hypothetical protein
LSVPPKDFCPEEVVFAGTVISAAKPGKGLKPAVRIRRATMLVVDLK